MIEPSIFLIANMNEILLFTYPTLESSSNPYYYLSPLLGSKEFCPEYYAVIFF